MVAIAAAHTSHDVIPPWIALVIYAAGFVITARVLFVMSPITSDRTESRLAAVCFGLLWPIAAVVAIACCVLALPTLGAKTKADRLERAAQLRLQIWERDRRIAELEREAGITDSEPGA